MNERPARDPVYRAVIPAAALICLLAASPAHQAPPPDPLLVVLSDTGRQQDGRPIVERIDSPRHLEVLTDAYPERVLRLYRMVQRFAHPDKAPQPAYLVLSDNQGGFPRAGFVLDGQVQADAAFVDLHRRSDLTGRPGAMDQMFPHELMHIIVAELAGEAPEGKASQVHAIGVRTDRVTAFTEGFAEHAQVMAIDDHEAHPDTHEIAIDSATRDRVIRQFNDYGRAIKARWAIAPKARMTFLLWFSNGEQVLRYHAVKDNLFAHAPDVPERLLTASGAYRAYLLENVLPGRADAPPKSAARLLASEGFVSALFYQLLNSPAIRNGVRDEAFYRRFGVSQLQIEPLDNAYLKVFAAIREGHYDAAAVIEAYAGLFPEEADAARGVLRNALLGQDVPRAPEIWLLNEQFTAGTTLFDQYRALPRPQTFDLNAASGADLAAVPNVDRALARAILQAAPFASVDDLQRVGGMTPQALAAFHEMRRAMDAPLKPGASAEGSLSIRSIVLPYVWRALKVWLVCALIAAALYRGMRRVSWWRLVLNGLCAALVGLIAGWTIDSGNGVLALAMPLAIFGLPAALIALRRTRSPRAAATALGAWGLASLPAVLAVVPF